jgi:hypothetical protein
MRESQFMHGYLSLQQAIPKEIVLVNIVVQVKTNSSTIKCKIVLQILN